MAEADRIKWNARYQQQASSELLPAEAGEIPAPAPWLVAAAKQIHPGGRVLDLAGGTGRHALWLAAAGFEVTLADISEVALERAAQESRHRNLPLNTLAIDLDNAPFPAAPFPATQLPIGQLTNSITARLTWDAVVCTYFLWRPIFTACHPHVSPGGLLIIAHPTIKNLERHPRPPAQYLLQPDELRQRCTNAAGWQLLTHEESWTESNHHEARLVARRVAH